MVKSYNAFNVYCRELAPGTVSLTGYRAQGDDGKHCAYCNKLFGPRQTCMHFMKVLTVYTLTSHVLTLKAHITKSRMFLLSVETYWSSLIWVHTVCVYYFKGNFGYCPRASFLRRGTRKVVWVPSFDHFQIRINTGFRYVYVWWMFPHFLDKKVTRMCPKYLLTRYYK